MPSSRRRYLRGCVATLGLATAGCLGSNEYIETSPVGTEATPESEDGTTTHTQSEQTDSWTDGDPRNRFKFALDATTGTKRWGFDAERDLTDVSVGETRAYVAADDTVYALE